MVIQIIFNRKKSVTRSTVNSGCGSNVSDAAQISFSLGTTNIREPTQKKKPGKTRAAFFR